MGTDRIDRKVEYMSDESKILSMIGLATKAGKTVTGTQACSIAIKRKRTKLVIIASDASENTRSPAINICNANGADYVLFSTRDELGHYTGKSERAILAITDEGFSSRIGDMINSFNKNNK